MPPAVEAFMRHLTEYLHSSDHQTATLSSDDAAEVKLSLSAETQKDMDRVPFPAEPDPEGESSGSAQPSGLTGVDCEQTGDCSSVRMDSPVEMARDNHQEGHSGAAGGESRDIFSTDMDRILRAVWRDVQSVPRNVNLQSRWKLPSGRGLLAYVVRLCVGYLEARPGPRRWLTPRLGFSIGTPEHARLNCATQGSGRRAR
jgi:hypothetical protein